MHPRQQRLLTALAVLLLALVAVITWIEPPAEDAGDFEDPVAVRADQLEGLILETDGRRVVATRTAGGWLLEAPLQARADDAAIDGLVGLVDRLRLGPVLDGLDPSIYGLAPPEAVLTLQRADGTEHTLAVGTTAPVGFRTYIQLDGGGVRLAEGHPMTTLGRPVETLRDRAVHRFASSAVLGLRWRDEDTRWAVTRREGAWFLGDGRRASTPRVQAVMDTLAELDLETFQDGLRPEDLAGLGLAPPHATVSLEEPGGLSELAIGGERAGGVLVRTPGQVLGTVAGIAPLLMAPGTLLEERVLPATTAEATGLALSYAGVEVSWTRDGDAWLRDGTLSAGARTDVVDLLTQLPADRAALLPAGTPAGDYVEVTTGARSVRVWLGDAVPGGRVAWSDGEPGFRVSSDALVILENVALGAPPTD